MQLFVLALSRLVPLLFMASFTLVGARYIHDLVLERRPALARWAFAGVCLIGLLGVAPYTLRATLLVAARWATHHERWALADLLHAEYDAWNGSRDESIVRQWAYARMGRNDWKGAEEVLRLTEPTMQVRLLAGLCQYNAGDPRAEATLAAIPDTGGTQLCVRDYLLGRLAARRGDPARAFALYGRAVQWEPHFFPATYHGVRLMLAARQPARARAILESFVKAYPGTAADPKVHLLRDAVARGAVPPDEEFVIVSD